MTVELDASISAELVAALNGNTAALNAAERRKREAFAGVTYFPAPAFQFSSGATTVCEADKGPKDGYTWAVQHVTISGLAALTDFINLYRGTSPLDVQGQNAEHTFQVSVVGGLADWHPGGKGFLLRGSGKERLITNGTFTGTLGIVSYDVIQIEDAQLRYYLI